MYICGGGRCIYVAVVVAMWWCHSQNGGSSKYMICMMVHGRF